MLEHPLNSTEATGKLEKKIVLGLKLGSLAVSLNLLQIFYHYLKLF